HHGDRDGRVLVRGGAVVGRDRGVVHRVDGDRERGGAGVHRPVVRLEGEAVRPVVVGRRGVRERAVGGQGQRPVGRAGHQAERQRVSVHVGGGRVPVERRVLVGCSAPVRRQRGVIYRDDRNGLRGHVRVGLAIVGLEGERVGTVVVRGRGICERPV